MRTGVFAVYFPSIKNQKENLSSLYFQFHCFVLLTADVPSRSTAYEVDPA